MNATSGKTYRGVNIPVLWVHQMKGGFKSGLWGTYKQWAEKGAQVRKGEKGSHIVFWKTLDVEPQGDNEEGETRMFARWSVVLPPAPAPITRSISTADLKRMYRVSAAALLVRLKDIGVISESVLTYAFQSFANGWRTSEPDPLEPEHVRGLRERPKRFERLCYRALAEDLISVVKAAELLRCSVSEVKKGLRGPDFADHHQ
jgi:hypothetical protein